METILLKLIVVSLHGIFKCFTIITIIIMSNVVYWLEKVKFEGNVCETKYSLL